MRAALIFSALIVGGVDPHCLLIAPRTRIGGTAPRPARD